jgi:hypothetical protein
MFTRKGIEMIAGLPGTGVGGVFYLMSVFLMPVREMGRVVRGRSSLRRWRVIFGQMGIASGVLAGFWITGWILTLLIPAKMLASKGSGHGMGNVLEIKPFMISMYVLIAVILAVECVSLYIRKKPKVC